MITRWFSGFGLFVLSASVWAVSPYLQGNPVSGGDVQTAAAAVEARLKGGGFRVVGKYFPKNLGGYGVVVATDDAMLDEIASVGGNAVLGAAIRVGVKADGSVRYTNPDYWQRAYLRDAFARKESAVTALRERLAAALGAGRGQGGDEPPDNLANYRYMVGMERIDSPKNRLAEYGSFAEALKTVRENLARGAGKTGKVYEVILPKQKLAVFGIAMNGVPGDGEWLKKIDMQDNVAGLPYEVYVVDGQVASPNGRYRIALAFPDVGMGQFMRISSLPGTILETMSTVAGVEKKPNGETWQ